MSLSSRLPRDNAPRFPSEAECPPRVHSNPKRPQGEQKGKTWMMTLNIESSTAGTTRACVAETAVAFVAGKRDCTRLKTPPFLPTSRAAASISISFPSPPKGEKERRRRARRVQAIRTASCSVWILKALLRPVTC